MRITIHAVPAFSTLNAQFRERAQEKVPSKMLGVMASTSVSMSLHLTPASWPTKILNEFRLNKLFRLWIPSH